MNKHECVDGAIIPELEVHEAMKRMGARAHKLVAFPHRGSFVIPDSKRVPNGADLIRIYERNKPMGKPVGYTTSPVSGETPGLFEEVHVHRAAQSKVNGIPVRFRRVLS